MRKVTLPAPRWPSLDAPLAFQGGGDTMEVGGKGRVQGGVRPEGRARPGGLCCGLGSVLT